ncbi:golgi-body localization protein domain-containing protein [Dunaliella salina]|nr:golgi-body localization protein domain-containing protein [Dunaliella salina]|eukprot:KAF5836546.1 golgi-body localization protein domain-containing protein [Dunaliella salina]
MQQVESALALVPPHMEYHPSLLSHMHLGPGTSMTSNALARNLQVLVAWHLDQVVGAAESVTSTEQVLQGLRTKMEMGKLTRKRASKNGSTSSTIVLGGLKWGLSRGGSVFVVAELSGLEFTTAEDQAGMGEGNQLMQEPSPWEHDNALTLYAIHGGKDPRMVVYDHIEVVLHPLLVHITFNLAQTLQDYFNLREPEECAPCREAAGNAPGSSAQEGLPPKTLPKRTGSKKPSWLQRHSGQTPRVSEVQSGSSIQAGAQQGVQGPLTSGMARGRSGYTKARSGRGVSSGQMPTSSAQQYQTLSALPSSTSSLSQQQQQQQHQTQQQLDKKEHNPKKTYRFKHVRFNRMHVRLSYEGPPLSVTNFMLVLDASVYRGLEGGWRTILNRYKKDVIVSLLKSMAGWQNRKVKELERGAAASAAASAAAAAADSTGLTNLRDTDPSALLGQGDAGNVAGQGRQKGIRGHVKSWLGNIGVMHSSNAETGGGSAVRRSSAEERAIADLIAAAERQRVRQQKVMLLLGPNVPPPPARKLLQ